MLRICRRRSANSGCRLEHFWLAKSPYPSRWLVIRIDADRCLDYLPLDFHGANFGTTHSHLSGAVMPGPAAAPSVLASTHSIFTSKPLANAVAFCFKLRFLVEF
jgi:hypothetical protein